VTNKQTKKEQLNQLREKWNWDSKEAIEDRVTFILNKARQDYLRVYGKADGIALARYQSELLHEDRAVGTQRAIRRQERARARNLILETFKDFPRDTVTGMIAAGVVDEITGSEPEDVFAQIELDPSVARVETGPISLPSPGDMTGADGSLFDDLTSPTNLGALFGNRVALSSRSAKAREIVQAVSGSVQYPTTEYLAS